MMQQHSQQADLPKTMTGILIVLMLLTTMIWLPVDFFTTSAFILEIWGTPTQATVSYVNDCSLRHLGASPRALEVNFIDEHGLALEGYVECPSTPAHIGDTIAIRYDRALEDDPMHRRPCTLCDENPMSQDEINAVLLGPRGLGTLVPLVLLLAATIFSHRRDQRLALKIR